MYKKASSGFFKHADFFIFDILILAACYTLACLLRYSFDVPAKWAILFTRSGVAILVLFVIVAVVGRGYSGILQRNKWVELGYSAMQVFATFILFILYLYIIKEENFSRSVYGVTAALDFVVMWCWRVFYKHLLRVNMAKSNNLPQMLIVTEAEYVKEQVASVRKKQYDNFRVKGVVIHGNPDEEILRDGYVTTVKKIHHGEAGSGETEMTPVVCTPEELEQYLLTGVVDEVYVSLDSDTAEKKIARFCLEMGITVHIGLTGADMGYPNAMIENLGGNTVLTTSNNVSSTWTLAVKRAVDIIGGIVGCLIMLVMYVFVAPKIKKADKGPAFFSQVRIGKNGRRFRLYKFRSMYMDAEARKKELMAENEMKGQFFKMENDPRILPGIGKKIRESSVDEWPQFWNVLKGDMSLVGTRPPTEEEFSQYEAHHKARLSFKPGITGIWQVSGRSTITDFEQVVELDNKYIRDWSLMLDLKILLKTVKVVLKHEGAK